MKAPGRYTNFTRLDSDLANFKTYFCKLGADDNLDTELSDFYQSAISDNTNFIIYLDYNGSKHRVDGYRASSQYGYMVRMSYNKISGRFGTAQRTLNGGAWGNWDYNIKNSDFGYVRADVDGGQSWISMDIQGGKNLVVYKNGVKVGSIMIN